MATVKIFNAFSLQMLNNLNAEIRTYELSIPAAKEFFRDGFKVESYIGHADTAAVISNLLGTEIPMNRVFGKVSPGDYVIVAQVVGGRLPEGATTLPDGVEIKFIRVEIR